MLAKHNDVIHSELASVCAADCDEDASVARVEIHARNHEVVACITIHRVHGIAGIVEASPELTLKARLVPKRRVSRIVEVYDLVTDKNSRRTGYGMLSPDESHDAVDVAIHRCRLNARVRGIQRRLDYAVVGKSPVVDISQRHTDVSYVRA